ncbi:LysR family transcriptional regulator [Burkholderia multivorans]|uniref:LysR substrate-binding domain-containing protein n=1 Tax=Burkholderia multivorans TaxID=87883 RepID=UPI000CFFEC92|nr:LysR substrate-binding domain-containing protein [Burkholderia multivorans]MBU9366027.1 LysR family transcriptional regulator [Burkholderia multivorans]PRG77650.1 LysR family transcriptional regulator [Burkholderia multivorans]
MNSLLTSASLRRLQVFLAGCETLHMARAAEQLGVAQPALSQQIKGLEDALGVRLFNRRKRGIDLTTAGESFRAEAQKLLALHGQAIDIVRRTARGEMGRLAIGYVPSAMFERSFPLQLRAMREQHPNVELILRDGTLVELSRALLAGEIDVALVRAPVPKDLPLRHRVHSTQELTVILPAGHALAALDKIPLARLVAEPMIGFPDPDNVGIMHVVANLAAKAGATLEQKWRVADVGSILGLVAAGVGFGIVPRNFAQLAGPEIVARPLAGRTPRAELWLVWHEEKETPALKRFLAMAARK